MPENEQRRARNPTSEIKRSLALGLQRLLTGEASDGNIQERSTSCDEEHKLGIDPSSGIAFRPFNCPQIAGIPDWFKISVQQARVLHDRGRPGHNHVLFFSQRSLASQRVDASNTTPPTPRTNMFEIEHGMLALSLLSRRVDLAMTCTGGRNDSVRPSAGTKDATRQQWLMCPC